MNKLIIIIIILVLVGLVGAGLGWWFFLREGFREGLVWKPKNRVEKHRYGE